MFKSHSLHSSLHIRFLGVTLVVAAILFCQRGIAQDVMSLVYEKDHPACTDSRILSVDTAGNSYYFGCGIVYCYDAPGVLRWSKAVGQKAYVGKDGFLYSVATGARQTVLKGWCLRSGVDTIQVCFEQVFDWDTDFPSSYTINSETPYGITQNDNGDLFLITKDYCRKETYNINMAVVRKIPTNAAPGQYSVIPVTPEEYYPPRRWDFRSTMEIVDYDPYHQTTFPCFFVAWWIAHGCLSASRSTETRFSRDITCTLITHFRGAVQS